jgi:tetratricopeptide (TPR) repeat protein
MPTKKITYKEMKQDQFRTTVLDWVGKGREFLQAHFREVAWGVAAVLVILVVIWGINRYAEAREQGAENLLGQALLLMPEPTPPGGETEPAAGTEEASAAFQKLIDEYPGSDAAAMGRYYLALNQLRAGRVDEAGTALQAFLEENPGHPIRPMALLALAQVERGRGNAERAESAYRELVEADHAEVPGDLVRLMLAEFLEQEGRLVEAYGEYSQIPEESPSYPKARLKTEELLPLLPEGAIPETPEAEEAPEVEEG